MGPTDPTMGNGLSAGKHHTARLRPTAALFQPAQGIFPFPNDLYFGGTTDGTINIQPANGLIPEPGRPQRAGRLVDHRADPHPLRRRAQSRLVQPAQRFASTR